MSVFMLVLSLGLFAVSSGSIQQDDQDAFSKHEADQVKHVLLEQQRLLRQLDQRLSDQETLIHAQNARLSQQERRIRKLESQKSHCLLELQRFPAADRTQKTESDYFKGDSGPDLRPPKFSSLVLRDVVPRSDDADPLETVVLHLSQQLTDTNANVDSLKAQLTADIQSLRDTNLRQDNDIREAQTSTFTRWGSSHCTNASDLVYSGVVGGSDFRQTGAATDYLCLTLSPVPGGGNIWTGSYLFGAEYQTGESHYNKDVVCSVCRSRLPTTVMIPGTNVCTQGWRLQYSGYLMAGYHGHSAGSEFICVDSILENRPASSENYDGKLLYGVSAMCGSLPCEPYVNGTRVTCAVCSL